MSNAAKVMSILEARNPEAERFIQISEELSRLAGAELLRIVPYQHRGLPLFSRLSHQEKRTVLEQMETLLSVTERTHHHGLQILSAKSAVWGFAQQRHVTFPSDLIERLGESDMVDIYGLDHKLIFANFRFFEFASYSLEELYCRPWSELFSRNRPTVHEQLWQLSEEMVRGQHREIVPVDYIPMHIATETASQSPRRVLVRPRLFSPLFFEGQICAYLCVNSGAIL